MLLDDLRAVPVGARKAYAQLVAEPERRVVPPVDLDRHDWQARPLGKLHGNQPGSEVRSDRVPVHGGNHSSIAFGVHLGFLVGAVSPIGAPASIPGGAGDVRDEPELGELLGLGELVAALGDRREAALRAERQPVEVDVRGGLVDAAA
jgi:hypothetical protein